MKGSFFLPNYLKYRFGVLIHIVHAQVQPVRFEQQQIFQYLLVGWMFATGVLSFPIAGIADGPSGLELELLVDGIGHDVPELNFGNGSHCCVPLKKITPAGNPNNWRADQGVKRRALSLYVMDGN